APRAYSEPTSTYTTKPLTTGSDCPTVPPLRSTALCAAASSLVSARTITACSGPCGAPREKKNSATAANATNNAITTNNQQQRSSSQSQQIPHTTFIKRLQRLPKTPFVRRLIRLSVGLRGRLDTARRSYECARRWFLSARRSE